jgi:hypothetical protein
MHPRLAVWTEVMPSEPTLHVFRETDVVTSRIGFACQYIDKPFVHPRSGGRSRAKLRQAFQASSFDQTWVLVEVPPSRTALQVGENENQSASAKRSLGSRLRRDNLRLLAIRSQALGWRSQPSRSCERSERLAKVGWDAGIRTPITCSRGRCPTVERRPSKGVRGR